jgi:ribosome recycling factor
VTVDYYGTATRIKELAGISTPEPRLIIIQPWDPTVAPAIEKAIRSSDLGFNPVSDGKIIRIPVPELSEERRNELRKVLKNMAEESRISIRNIRRDSIEGIKKLQKDGTITEDEMFREEKVVQEKTDEYIREIDLLLEHKEHEIMEV